MPTNPEGTLPNAVVGEVGQSTRDRLAVSALLQALVVVGAYAVLVVLAAASWAVSLPLSGIHLVVAFLVSGGLAFRWGAGRLGRGRALRGVLLSFGILVAAGAVNARIYDTSWDGRDYHRRAAMLFADGFNPYTTLAEPQDAYYNRWINHFPRGPWIANAAALKLTGNLEVGKAVDLWLIWATFCAGVGILAPVFGGVVPAVLGAAVLTANPIAVGQIFTNYVDGQAASLLTLLLLFGVWVARAPSVASVLALAATLLLALNVKFTLTGIVLLWSPLAAGLALWWARREKWSAGRIRNVAAALVAAGVVGLAGVGYAPYVRNTVDFGNPFYPIMGGPTTSQVDPAQMDARFLQLPAWKRIGLSVFGASRAGRENVDLGIKVPFSVHGGEAVAFRSPDVRLGGFGPWFGGCVLVALVGLVALGGGHRRFAVLAAWGALILPAFLNEGGWWARYHPQLWLVPVLVALLLMRADGSRRRRLGIVLTGLLLVNAAFVTGARVYAAVADSAHADAVLDDLRQVGGPVALYPSVMVGSERLLEAHGLPFTLVQDSSDLPCPAQPLIYPVLISPTRCETP